VPVPIRKLTRAGLKLMGLNPPFKKPCDDRLTTSPGGISQTAAGEKWPPKSEITNVFDGINLVVNIRGMRTILLGSQYRDTTNWCKPVRIAGGELKDISVRPPEYLIYHVSTRLVPYIYLTKLIQPLR
jgi:hypothetical protein